MKQLVASLLIVYFPTDLEIVEYDDGRTIGLFSRRVGVVGER